MPPVMFSVVTKYHKGRHSLFLYNSEIFYAFTQDILRSHLIIIQINIFANIGRKTLNFIMIINQFLCSTVNGGELLVLVLIEISLLAKSIQEGYQFFSHIPVILTGVAIWEQTGKDTAV